MKKSLVAALFVCFALALASSVPAGEMRSGQTIYEKHCSMCHATGVAGAPKFGNAADWKEHMAEGGVDHMVMVATKGEGAMPPMGGCIDCTVDELKAAIQYMLDNSK